MRSSRRKRQQAGFSLIELVVVLVIIMVVVSIAAWDVLRKKQEVNVAQVAQDLRTRIEKVRSMTSVVGSRLGTDRFKNECTGGSDMGFRIDPSANTLQLPEGLTFDSSTPPKLIAKCITYDIGLATQGKGKIGAPTAAQSFTFTSEGRLQGGNAYLLIQADELRRPIGLRILSSGIACWSVDPTNGHCDEA